MDLLVCYTDYVRGQASIPGMSDSVWNLARWLRDEIGEEKARKVCRDAGVNFDIDPFSYGRMKA